MLLQTYLMLALQFSDLLQRRAFLKLKTQQNIGTGSVTVYTVPSNTTSVLIGANLSNTSAGAIGGSLIVNTDTDDTETNENVFVVKQAPIPVGSALEVMAGNKIVLQTTDVVQAQSDTSGSLDVSLSLMEIT